MSENTNQSSPIKTKLEQLRQLVPLRTSENSSDNKDKKPQEFFAQNLVDVEDIVAGLIFTKSGSVVKILEVLPLNFTEKDGFTQDMIADAFGYGLKCGPKSAHIKVMRSQSDITPFIRNVREAMRNETDENLMLRVEDYLTHTQHLQERNTRKNRFFYIFEYEGDDKGKKSANWDDIYDAMRQITYSVTTALRSTGNYVIDYAMTGDNISIAEILYSHFNPKTSKKEPFTERQRKVIEASNFINRKEGTNISAPLDDFIAPRGIRFGRWDYVVMDGMYHTYLSLSDESFPKVCYAGIFTQSLMEGLDDCDLDIYYTEKPREMSLTLLERTGTISRGVSLNYIGDNQKQEKLHGTASNADYIRSRMKDADEELYDVSIILTIRANTLRELREVKKAYLRNKRSDNCSFESCFMKTQEYFNMVTPLMNINQPIFKENARNMTNDGLASLYCFNSFEMFDPAGACMGKTVKEDTLFSLNNFDTNKFPNPHIFIAGTSGAGKTFTELMLTSRMRMHGSRIVYILPLKGHEYKEAVLSLGGEFISLRPGGNNCINIMEIRPEGTARLEGLNDEEIAEELAKMPSLLSKKITSITTWLRLLVGEEDRLTVEEVGELNALLQELYHNFGITEDNNSIWQNQQKGILKRMPIIEDMYNAMLNNELLSRRTPVLKTWVFGNCKNMNQQTNVDMTKKVLAFDINEDYIGEELLPAYMYIAFDAGYDICKEDEYETCVIALDEIWKLLQIPACAKQIDKMIRILRAYGASAITATQDIDKCLENEFGKSILQNSAIKIFLTVTKEEMAILEKSVTFTEENKQNLLNAPKGIGFVTYQSEKVFVRFIASEYEEELYTTDINKKRELRQRRMNKRTAYA